MGALLVGCPGDDSPVGNSSDSGSSTGADSSTGDVTPPPGTSTGSDSESSTSEPTTTGLDSSSGDPTTGPGMECGNGVVEGDEVCDTDDLAGNDCVAEGFDGGELACNPSCSGYDTSGCTSFSCGNNVADPTEMCDGPDFGGQTCADLGFDNGDLECSLDCQSIDTAGCGTCGNVIVDGNEVCDDIVLLGQTCLSQGFDSGTLGCAGDCLTYDTTGCGTCGNFFVDGAEFCDDMDLGGATCLDFPAYDSGTLGCDASCEEFDFSGCTTVCGNGIIAGNEACEGMDLGGATCAGIGLGGGTLGCLPNCQFDLSGCDDQFGVACDNAMPPNCFIGAFMASAGGVAANLYAMSLDGLQTVDYGPLGVQITGLAFHPNGTLYGVDPGNGQLVTIDPTFPPAVNVVGPTVTAGGASHFNIPDIAFMGTQLIGWSENGDDLVMIDHTTGILTVVTSPQGSFGTGMTYNSTTDEILLAPSGSSGTLYTVSAMGAVTAGPNLAGTMGNVKGLSFNSTDGLMYGFDATGFGGGGNFVTYDPATGAMNVLAPIPHPNIDAIAVYDLGNLGGP